MPAFQLHPQLDKDCYSLGELQDCRLLLIKNAMVPWFILVPQTQASEIFELEEESQGQLLKAINQLSRILKTDFSCDKVNVAAIGNKVRQLHVHVIARFEGDYCWPDTVWGRPEFKEYQQQEIDDIKSKIAPLIS